MELFKKDLLLFSCVLVLFIGLHVAGLWIPYHQDEYKWVYYAKPELNPPGTIPHPPLTEFIYTSLGPIVGDNNFRLIPFAFGLTNLFLIFYLGRILFDKKTALWTAFLFTVSFYSLLASLMVDVDGAVLAMFFLIMTIGYVKFRSKSFEFKAENWKWLALLILGAVGGVLVKMSGALPIAALALDFGIEKKLFSDKKKFLKFIGLGILIGAGLLAVLLIAKIVFPFFPIEKSLKYWSHFANSSGFLSRGWFQTFVQFSKSILYVSPLLILPVFLISREIWQKTRPLFLFIIIGLLFYLFAFDFSIGALDRYLQFLIIPLCLISGAVFARHTSPLTPLLDKERGKKTKFSWGEAVFLVLISIAIFSLQFFPHFAPSQYPKTEWLSRVLSLKWNFLFPFTGGSGPTGFYLSFAFLGLMWASSLILAIFALHKKDLKKQAVIAILVMGLSYNAVFAEEYLFGKINGSPYGIFREAKKAVIENPEIKSVLVYNDIGGFEIQQTGKYKRRIYAAPQFEETYKSLFKNFSGHILFIDIPKPESGSLYDRYFNGCLSILDRKDKYIRAQILDCRK